MITQFIAKENNARKTLKAYHQPTKTKRKGYTRLVVMYEGQERRVYRNGFKFFIKHAGKQINLTL